MPARFILLCGAAAFGLALLGAGALFEEPGGGARLDRRPAQVASSDLKWELWQVPEQQTASDPAPQPTDEADEASATGDGDAQPSVWSTPAEWSEDD